MKTIGTFEAKTHLSEILDTVSKGETIAITKRGKVVAHLTPPFAATKAQEDALVLGFREFQKTVKTGRESIRELIDAGRKR